MSDGLFEPMVVMGCRLTDDLLAFAKLSFVRGKA
jgi:hypothetical protein